MEEERRPPASKETPPKILARAVENTRRGPLFNPNQFVDDVATLHTLGALAAPTDALETLRDEVSGSADVFYPLADTLVERLMQSDEAGNREAVVSDLRVANLLELLPEEGVTIPDNTYTEEVKKYLLELMQVNQEAVGNNRTGFAESPEVREVFGGTLPKPELVNFLIGAAFIGNSAYDIKRGMTDSRTWLAQEELPKITETALIQLKVIAEKLRGRIDVPSYEKFKVMVALHGVLELSKSPMFHVPQSVLNEVEIFATSTLGDDWTGLDRRNSDDQRKFFKNMHITPSGKNTTTYGIEPDFLGQDFVGNRFGTIMREFRSGVNQEARLWDDYNDLLRFRKPYLQKSKWQRLKERVRRTGTENDSQQPPFIQTLQ